MANRPTETTGWATNIVDETVNINSNNILVRNKVEPTQEFKNSGVLAREPWSRSYLNWLFNFIMRYIDNFNTRTSVVGKVELTTDNSRTVTDYANEFGGTWVDRGTDTLAGQTVNVFERTV